MKSRLLALLVLVGITAAACAPAPKRPDPAAVKAYEDRVNVLAGLTRWEITGRLAITDGEQGGSGSLHWVQDHERTSMSFRGTFGRGAWMLEADDGGAWLRLADGESFHAPDVATLVQAQVGWKVPVEALAWWVRGMAAGDSWRERQIDAAGRLLRLRQLGWEVEFDHYREHASVWLPARLFARRGDYAVKLVVRDWRIGGEDAGP